MSYSIREATERDAAELLALTQELAAFEKMVCVATADQFRRALSGPVSLVHASLIETEDVVAGYALWLPTFSTFLGRSGIWLEDLYVRPTYRRRGLGRALLTHLRTRTDGRVEWDVLEWNARAISLYEHLGARPVPGWTRYRWLP